MAAGASSGRLTGHEPQRWSPPHVEATPAPSAKEGGGAGAAAAAAAAVVGAAGRRAAQGGGHRRPHKPSVSSVDSRSATTGADERRRETQRISRGAYHPSKLGRKSGRHRGGDDGCDTARTAAGLPTLLE